MLDLPGRSGMVGIDDASLIVGKVIRIIERVIAI